MVDTALNLSVDWSVYNLHIGSAVWRKGGRGVVTRVGGMGLGRLVRTSRGRCVQVTEHCLVCGDVT